MLFRGPPVPLIPALGLHCHQSTIKRIGNIIGAISTVRGLPSQHRAIESPATLTTIASVVPALTARQVRVGCADAKLGQLLLLLLLRTARASSRGRGAACPLLLLLLRPSPTCAR